MSSGSAYSRSMRSRTRRSRLRSSRVTPTAWHRALTPRYGTLFSGGGLGPGGAEVVHGALPGVWGEKTPQFVRRDLQEVAVAGGVEGFEEEGDAGGVLGDAGAVGVAVVPVAGQDPGGVGVDDLA